MRAETLAAPAPAVHTLVERAVARDQAAFSELYKMYVDKVYRHAYYLLGSPHEAEDITAQAFLQAWQAIHRYRTTGAPFVAWLIRIAHNLAVSYYRRRRTPTVLTETLSDTSIYSSPDTMLQSQEGQERLLQAIKGLKAIQQQVITLRFIDELEYREVAAITGKSVAAVRVIQHRALVALRQALRGDAAEATAPQELPRRVTSEGSATRVPLRQHSVA